MSQITNYSQLITAIQEIVEDDSAEFLSYIPTAIGLAEDRLFRILDINFTKLNTSLSLSAAVTDLAKPADWRVTRNFYIVVSNARTRLTKVSEDYLRDYWPISTQTDVPKYYCDKDRDTWTVAPTPDLSYQVNVEYEYKPTPLSGSNATNIFIDDYSDLLFYCSLSAVSEWMKDPEMKAEWEAKIVEALASANNEGRRQRQDDNTHVQNMENGQNTKKRNDL